MKSKLSLNLITSVAMMFCVIQAQAQSAGTSKTENSGFAAGRHADGGTGVRKAQSNTTTSTSGDNATGGSGGTSSSSSTIGNGGTATAGSGVNASSIGTGGSSAGTQNSSDSTAASTTGSGSSASASGPSGSSASHSSGSTAEPSGGLRDMHATMLEMKLGHMEKAVLLDNRKRRKIENNLNIVMNPDGGRSIDLPLYLVWR